MPIDLKYKIPPTFLVDGKNYAECGYFRRPLPATGGVGLPDSLQMQTQTPFIEARFYQVKNFKEEQLRVARSEQTQTYYVSTGNFANQEESRNAFIKSFRLSVQNGFGATLEIIDTSGNDFVGFYNTIYKNQCFKDDEPAANGQAAQNAVKIPNIFIVSVNVGYVFLNSEGQKVVYQSYFNAPSNYLPGRTIGPYLNFFLIKTDVDISTNVWRYTLHLSAPDGPLSNQVVIDRKGAPGKEVPLLTAAEMMLDGSCPPKFIYEDPRKARVAIIEKPKGVNGKYTYTSERGAGSIENATRRGVFAGYNLPPLDAIRKNMDTFVTRSDKGVFMHYPTGANDDTLYLLEAESVFCIQKRGSIPQCGYSAFAGTYVVNGGDFSPVISFNPKISYQGIPNKLSGGVAGGGTSTKSIQVNQICKNNALNSAADEKDKATTQGQTVSMSSAISNDSIQKEAPKNLPQLQATAGAAALAAENASKPFLQGAVAATMVIQGDPRFLWSSLLIGTAIKIIFVNPFAITTRGSPIFGTETDWLATPKINSVISDGIYLINSCDHEISNGSWRTTLQMTQWSLNPIVKG